MISVTLSQLTDILNGELQGADIAISVRTSTLASSLRVCWG